MPTKTIQDNKNIFQKKNSYGRIFGKEIGNSLNNRNGYNNIKYIKSKNISKENIINKNKENKKYENNMKNNNIIRPKNDENNQNNFIVHQNIKKNNLNKNFFIKNKESYKLNKTKQYIIYNKNPIEEYDEAIMKNLFIEENNNRPDYQKMYEIFNEEETTQRFICLNTLLNISETFEFRQETIYLTINIFDRYILHLKLSNKLKINDFKIILLTCIFIASKYEEIYPPTIDDYLEIFSFFEKDEIFKLEYKILDYTKFELLICSPYLFLTKFFDALEKNESKKILHGAQFILDICIISIEFCIFKPSLQAAICLYLSKKFFNNRIYKMKLWPMENEYATGYSEYKIKKNLIKPLQILKHFFTNNLIKNNNKTALYKKYNNNKYSEISNEFKKIFIKN